MVKELSRADPDREAELDKLVDLWMQFARDLTTFGRDAMKALNKEGKDESDLGATGHCGRERSGCE